MRMPTCYYHRHTRSIADLVDDGGVMVITRINVPSRHRQEGLGGRILRQILRDADIHGVTLRLEIMPSGGLNFDQLEDWYRRHGFVLMEDRIMERAPGKPVGELDEAIQRASED